jgi:hypothetical protein
LDFVQRHDHARRLGHQLGGAVCGLDLHARNDRSRHWLSEGNHQEPAAHHDFTNDWRRLAGHGNVYKRRNLDEANWR